MKRRLTTPVVVFSLAVMFIVAACKGWIPWVVIEGIFEGLGEIDFSDDN